MRTLVTLTLAVATLAGCSQNDRSDRGERRGGGNREARFERLDRNDDGFVEASEAPPRMQRRIARLDANGDGKLSKDEFTGRGR